jgi:hypothetical protein
MMMHRRFSSLAMLALALLAVEVAAQVDRADLVW